MFFSFLRFFILQNNKEAHIGSSKEILTHKNCKKGCPNASKWRFSTKKACKINIYASKRLKYGLKLPFGDPKTAKIKKFKVYFLS